MREYVGGYFMMATFVLFAASIALDGAALCMPQWLVAAGDRDRVARGLWRQCVDLEDSSACTPTERTVTENLVISFLVLSAIFKAPSFVLCICKSWRFDKCHLPLTAITALAGVLTIAAVSVYAASPPDFGRTASTTTSFGFSFEATAGNAALTIVLTLACWHVFLTKELLDNAPKAPLGSTKIERSVDVRILF